MSYAYRNINNQKTPYRLIDLNVFFNDLNCMEIIKAVLDEKGTIKNFPGMIKDERWESRHRIGQCYDVRFEAQFYAMENEEYLMLWMIQPSGWYWVDEDGFGFTGDPSIMLYSVLDKTGNFMKCFRLFSINGERYCHDYDAYL